MRLLSVGPMSEFREPKIKVCKVEIKMLLENFCGGPPICMDTLRQCITMIKDNILDTFWRIYQVVYEGN